MSNPSQPRLLSFALDDWDVLGGRVSVSLRDGVAVLVGRNGAGKSAILEGFEAISLYATGRFRRIRLNDSNSFPKILDVEVLTPDERRLGYRYELTVKPTSIDDSDIDDSDIDDYIEESQFFWSDCCQYLDEQKEIVWTTEIETGVTSFRNGEDPVVLGSTSSLQRLFVPENIILRRLLFSQENTKIKLPDEMKWVSSVLRGIQLLGKTPTRRSKRRESFVIIPSKGISSSFLDLADILARKMVKMVRTGKEELDELESICQRIGLGSKIFVKTFFPSGEPNEQDEGEESISSVLLDGVNLGLLSDGTLRVLSILIEIMSSHPSATTIVEEPETQIHPGMLAKLLNEIETYTYGENLILSTHSPQVVAWTSPDKINLVHRDHGRSIVRQLGEDEIQRVFEYLNEEGDLGEWLYSGILDE